MTDQSVSIPSLLNFLQSDKVQSNALALFNLMFRMGDKTRYSTNSGIKCYEKAYHAIVCEFDSPELAADITISIPPTLTKSSATA